MLQANQADQLSIIRFKHGRRQKKTKKDKLITLIVAKYRRIIQRRYQTEQCEISEIDAWNRLRSMDEKELELMLERLRK